MRRSFVDLPSLVALHVVLSVNVHSTIRVDGNHHLADIRVDLSLLISVQTTSQP